MGLGGKENISDLDCCATRLRITVLNENKIDAQILKQSGASGVICKGKGVQIVYGPRVSVIKSNLEDYMEHNSLSKTTSEKTISEPKAKEDKNLKSPIILGSHITGTTIPLNKVPDEAFSSFALGKGIAAEPEIGKLYAPADGVVENLYETGHAIGIKTKQGAEILLHIGIDTVKLKGEHFSPKVKNGQAVKKGDLLICFDIDGIKQKGYNLATPMIICNSDDYKNVIPLVYGKIKAAEDILKIE